MLHVVCRKKAYVTYYINVFCVNKTTEHFRAPKATAVACNFPFSPSTAQTLRLPTLARLLWLLITAFMHEPTFVCVYVCMYVCMDVCVCVYIMQQGECRRLFFKCKYANKQQQIYKYIHNKHCYCNEWTN